ncbi:MAG: hypothetical protein KDJ65_19460 [Anaerolineae bacterium]|nr:hypothetical protein [Anaerolineae bacterium]
MKPSSAKAKARRLQNAVAALIRRRFGLAARDVRPASMGAHGADVQLSADAAARFPFAVECKNTERLNVWEALAQAEANADGLTPLLVFKRNRSKTYVTLEFEQFLELLEQKVSEK